jgi:hypothetical protein
MNKKKVEIGDYILFCEYSGPDPQISGPDRVDDYITNNGEITRIFTENLDIDGGFCSLEDVAYVWGHKPGPDDIREAVEYFVKLANKYAIQGKAQDLLHVWKNEYMYLENLLAQMEAK